MVLKLGRSGDLIRATIEMIELTARAKQVSNGKSCKVAAIELEHKYSGGYRDQSVSALWQALM